MTDNCCGGLDFGMMVLWAIVLAAIVIGAILLVGALSHFDEQSDQDSVDVASGLDILEEQFARGEIDRDEFEQRRQTLRS